MNVVPLPAFIPKQPQGPRFGGCPAFPNPLAILQQHYNQDEGEGDDNDDTLHENLDETVIPQPPRPPGMRMKLPFPPQRTKQSKSSSSSDKNRLQLGLHTADMGTKTKTKTDIKDIPTPDASFCCSVAQNR